MTNEDVGRSGLTSHDVGRAGETAARQYLLEQGCEVIAAGVRLPQGELDLIVRDGTALVFVEVKARRSIGRGRPAEAVGPAKQRRLALLARAWLARNPRWRESAIRFDVVALTGRPDAWQIEHIRDAFRPV